MAFERGPDNRMKQQLLDEIKSYMDRTDAFRIGSDVDDKSLVGAPMYGEPVIGVCDANDEWFTEFQKEGVVGPHHKKPADWLPNARVVISVFLPLSQIVRETNRGGNWPGEGWLHARYEGQKAIDGLSEHLRDYLRQQGFDAVSPTRDAGFKTGNNGYSYTSNWSERHVAFACNLGTFSLSRGLITGKGVAGRFFSVVTNAPVEVDARQEKGKEANCTRCGDCVAACPAGAITLERGKDHVKCSKFLDTVMEKMSPRYGCGKCQAGVSCESSIPGRKGQQN